MMTKFKLLAFIFLSLFNIVNILKAEDMIIPVISRPIVLDEGIERELTPSQIAALLPWAKNSKMFLTDLLENVQREAVSRKIELLIDGIKQVVGESAAENSELSMRYVLNRGLVLDEIISREMEATSTGFSDVRLRILTASIQMAIKYYDTDVNYLAKKMVEPSVFFAIDYFEFLSELDKSIFDASAQYIIQKIALEWLQWDLYRDVNKLKYAPLIVKINNSLKFFPNEKISDAQSITFLRQMKGIIIQLKQSEIFKKKKEKDRLEELRLEEIRKEEQRKRVRISAGLAHTCVLDDTGVKCWGNNVEGQIQVPKLNNPKIISSGGYHTCALDNTELKCWGDNSRGQIKIPMLKNPRFVSAGNYHTCALDDNGVKCWGDNDDGQTNVPKLNNPKTVSAGYFFTCALDDDGVKCWGNNNAGQINVPKLKKPMFLSAGGFHVCVLDDNNVKCWGSSYYGQTHIPKLKNPKWISAENYHICALDDTGVKCWGNNDQRQVEVPMLKNPKFISAGGFHTCALDDDGIKCWGNNIFGQLNSPFIN